MLCFREASASWRQTNSLFSNWASLTWFRMISFPPRRREKVVCSNWLPCFIQEIAAAVWHLSWQTSGRGSVISADGDQQWDVLTQQQKKTKLQGRNHPRRGRSLCLVEERLEWPHSSMNCTASSHDYSVPLQPVELCFTVYSPISQELQSRVWLTASELKILLLREMIFVL